MKRCNGFTIPEFTKEQITECKLCRHLSGKKIWCCKFGVYISRSITAKPKNKIIVPPTLSQMAKHFTKAMIRWAKKGFKTVSKEVYFMRRLACSKCQPTGRCPHCGCNLWAKAALVTEKCPEDKW